MKPLRRHRLAGLSWLPCLIMLLPGLPAAAWAEEAQVWLALTDKGGIYAETAHSLGEELARTPRRPQLLTAPWQELPPPIAKPPELVVALGTTAFRRMVERAQKEPGLAHTPILAILIPRASYENLAPKPPLTTSAIFLDQPVERYVELLRRALPERKKIAILFGPDSLPLKPALSRAASARGLKLISAQVEAEDIYPALQDVLEEADVLLSLPDSRIYNPASFQSILITAYRQRVAMVTFSAGYVKAGATMALFTTPAQLGSQAATLIRNYLGNHQLPAAKYPAEFSVATNNQVARSLNLTLDEPDKIASDMRNRETLR